ncbi:lysophospholipid acyltransferase family protein [Luteolibacter yonseiensis]|uniref:Lysophospholipid acyltransferase family protein n=1 Tax=Luteolibacter yonseiensis TaxID=1144680 RepID=A0A934R9V8_9BACT|nr:lysophospholipid acyltransferase family protein [Luteolibacter yonseiensis]MBK1817825.1 lysophospholipid acyltransferase family protein [Luteolibacter yonseiensis]
MPTRLMLHTLRVLPWFLEPVLIAFWTSVFFGVAKDQRRAVAGNLRALFPQWSGMRATAGAWQVFWNFALTYVDAQRCETGTGAVDWVVDGLASLEDLAKREEGCIILTAHMGNYDLAAPMFASRFNRTLYTVRAPEREPETQMLRETEIRRREALTPNFRTLYNQEGNLLGIELSRLLGEGNVVAVQGDRVIFDVSPMVVEVESGLTMRLPKGPLFLARATGAPCFPLFIVRDGWRRYRVIVLPEMELPPRKRGDDDEAAKVWAGTILNIVRRHWRQWYVFEPLLEKRAPHVDRPV